MYLRRRRVNMARRKMKKMTPAITTLRYQMPYSIAGVTRYVDLMRDISKVNRRLYRQGMQVAVAGMTVISDGEGDPSTAPTLDFQVRTAGNTWVTHNVWKKGYELWRQMNKEVLSDNPSVQGKWADYKVYLTEDQASANTLDNLDGAARS